MGLEGSLHVCNTYAEIGNPQGSHRLVSQQYWAKLLGMALGMALGYCCHGAFLADVSGPAKQHLVYQALSAPVLSACIPFRLRSSLVETCAAARYWLCCMKYATLTCAPCKQGCLPLCVSCRGPALSATLD